MKDTLSMLIPKIRKRKKKKTKISVAEVLKKQAKVLVAIESDSTKATNLDKPHNKKRKAGYLKMIVVDDLSSETIDFEVLHAIDKNAIVETDRYKGYKNLNNLVKKHIAHKSLPKKEITKAFP